VHKTPSEVVHVSPVPLQYAMTIAHSGLGDPVYPITLSVRVVAGRAVSAANMSDGEHLT
jgi:hypothetical protein